MSNIEHEEDRHGDFDSLPLAVRMEILGEDADPDHVAAWAAEVKALEAQLAGAVDALAEMRGVLANLRDVAINGGAMEANGDWDVTVLQPLLDGGGQ